jgi:hypothetical protein
MSSEDLPTVSELSPAPLPPGISRRTRPRLAVRLRTSWKAPELDEALAAGSSPSETEELLWRATQLVEPEQRLGLADSLEEAVRAVDGNDRKRGLLDRRNLIRDDRSLLLVLAERLRGAWAS